jgi:hypothetical protein
MLSLKRAVINVVDASRKLAEESPRQKHFQKFPNFQFVGKPEVTRESDPNHFRFPRHTSSGIICRP